MSSFTADWVCPVSSPPLEHGRLVIEDGRIARVESDPDPTGRDESFPGCAIIPGFVNVHTHLELTLLRGFLEGLSFPEWIRTLTRTKYEWMTAEDLDLSARLGALECLAAGVTAIGEVTDTGAGWQAMCRHGLRGIGYQEVFGPIPEQAEEAVRNVSRRLAVFEAGQEAARRPGVSPHAPYTVSEPLYRRIGDLARRENLPVAIHIAESQAETQFVREGAGPFADYWRSRHIQVEARGVGPVALVDRLGLIGPRTLAIHAIEASPDEIRRLADSGTAVVHCPKSNLKLGHGIAPVWEFLEGGIRVGLGTDSVASNNSVDMFEEMRLAIFLQRTRRRDPVAIPAAAAFRMATLGGAECLGLQDQIGSLEPGKLADFTVVDLGDLALEPVYDPIEAMVFSANRGNVRATFIGGRQVDTDATALRAEAMTVASRLWKNRVN